jgi:RNA polymerase sigma factor (sigma-70 family)
MCPDAPPCTPITSCDTSIVDLLELCLDNSQDRTYWPEFLCQITTLLQKLVQRASRMYVLPWWLQPDDIVEDVIVRLLENNCTLLRKFHGKTKDEFIVYLAVISRSCLLGHLRRELAHKRWGGFWTRQQMLKEFVESAHDNRERNLLAREIMHLAQRVLKKAPPRDRVIFRLYFIEDLSFKQIAQIKGIGLSTPGVKKVMAGLKREIIELGKLHPNCGSGRRGGTNLSIFGPRNNRKAHHHHDAPLFDLAFPLIRYCHVLF